MTRTLRKLLTGSMLAASLAVIGTTSTLSFATAAPAAAEETGVAARWDTALQGYVKANDAQSLIGLIFIMPLQLTLLSIATLLAQSVKFVPAFQLAPGKKTA